MGIKNVTANEPYFQGHFPGHPIMPGVLQLEAIAQVAGILMFKRAETGGQIAYFMAAEDVKWRKPVRPGDVLTVETEILELRPSRSKPGYGVIRLRNVTTNQRGEIVQTMLASALVPRRSDSRTADH